MSDKSPEGAAPNKPAQPDKPNPKPKRIGPRKLLAVAKAQKFVIYAIFANILLYILAFLTRGMGDAVALTMLIVSFLIILFLIFSVFRLAGELYSQGIAAAFCVAVVIPVVSLITLLFLNYKAQSLLKNNGVKVGLMGALKNQR